MVTLHTFPMSPNGRKVHLVLEELGVPYELKLVDLMAGDHKKPEYLALNPNGKVPTLVDGSLVLWESNAILTYLAQKHPDKQLGGRTAADWGEIMRWLFFQTSSWSPAARDLFQHTLRLPPEQQDPRIAEDARIELARLLVMVNNALQDREYLAGHLSIADFSLLPSASFVKMLGIQIDTAPHFAAWLARMVNRPSWRRVAG